MVYRYREEVDPYKDFLCGQRETSSTLSKEQAMARHLGTWDSNWDRVTSENSRRDNAGLDNDSSPRWGNSLREGNTGAERAAHIGVQHSLHRSQPGSPQDTGGHYGAQFYQPGGSSQGGQRR